MNRKPYRVTSLVDPITSVAGRRVRPDDLLHLTDDEARWEKSRGLIVDAPADLPASPAVSPPPAATEKPARDPLDHDGDGRRGGSLPRAHGRRKGR